MSIQLLLAHADGRPFISGEGLPDEAAEWAVAPQEDEEWQPTHALRIDKDPNDLFFQRWGLIVPEGPEGKRLLEIVAPLRAARKAQQDGKEPLVFTAPKGLTAETAGAWWGNVYNSEDIDKTDRPLYLLMLGDPSQISWEAQQRFSVGAYVGRLAFENDAGYEAYVHKILACERAAKASQKKVRATFYTVRDGTAATSIGHRGLMAPTLDALTFGAKNNNFPASEIVDLGKDGPLSIDDFLRAAENRDPTMLFSVSHGIGTSPETSEEERRRIQGAMSFGSGNRITGDDIANRPFLPGGAWFFFACFSAGTPHDTSYGQWLQSMKEAGLNVRQSDIDSVFLALAKESSFVASLPRAALANPDGPLAVMGHVDLAWTFSFQDPSKKFRSSRFHNVFRGIVDHSRIGPSFSDLQLVFNDVNSDLTNMIDAEVRASKRNETLPDAKTRPAQKASLWMLRQDLAGYVLLGDPAAQVTASASPEEVRKVPEIVTTNTTTNPSVNAQPNAAAGDGPDNFGDAPAQTTNSLAEIDPERIESAVFAKVGSEALDALAKHYGVARGDLDAWIAAYQAAGRAAVGKKQSSS